MRPQARTGLGSRPCVNVARLENLSVTEQSTLFQLQKFVEISLHLRPHGLFNAMLYTPHHDSTWRTCVYRARSNLSIAQRCAH